jgi:hypothetical protein
MFTLLSMSLYAPFTLTGNAFRDNNRTSGHDVFCAVWVVSIWSERKVGDNIFPELLFILLLLFNDAVRIETQRPASVVGLLMNMQRSVK